MAAASLVMALASLGVLAWPFTGKYVAIGLGLFATLVAWRAGRRSAGRARPRLVAAAAVTLGVIAVLLGAAKVVLTLLAIDRLGGLFGP
jgi:hypothetical protein